MTLSLFPDIPRQIEGTVGQLDRKFDDRAGQLLRRQTGVIPGQQSEQALVPALICDHYARHMTPDHHPGRR
jgi:hypothetical protein